MSATASCAAILALLRASDKLATTLAPPVAAAIAPNTCGVTPGPTMPASAVDLSAVSITESIMFLSSESASGTGTHARMPPVRPSAKWACVYAHNSSTFSTRAGMGKPLECTVNAGKSLQPTPTTGTPSVSRYSSVRGKSRNDFAPAHTVTTGCAASAPKSAEMSPCRCESRCTPPMPPVANTPMPARLASNSDAETVVAPTDQR